MSRRSQALGRLRALIHFRKQRRHSLRTRSAVGNRWSGLETLERRILLDAVAWTGAGDGFSWSDDANWFNQDLAVIQAPGPGDDVTISDVADPTIVFNTRVQLDSLVTDEAFLISGGSLTLDELGTFQFNDDLTISGGVVNGSGDLTVDGLLSWTGGVLRGSGTIIAAGALDIDGNGTVTDTRTLRNAGTGTWNSGLISFGADAQFINDTNATLDYKATSGTTTGNGLLTNKGTFTLNDGTILDSSARFNNEGLIDIQGSSRLTFGNDSTHTGTVTGSTSAVLQFRGGTASLVAVSTMIDGPEMRISGGVVNGSGDLTVDGLLSWTGGVLRGSGTIIAAGALDIDGNGTVTDTRTLRNAGTGTWNSGLISFGADAQFINDTNATLDYKATSGTTTGNGLLTNKGTFTLNDGTILDSSARFNNEGLIDIQGSSRLTFGNDSTHTGTVTGSTSAVLQFRGGTASLVAVSTMIDGPEMRISGGVVNGSGDLTVDGLLSWTGGVLRGSGTIIAAGALDIDGNGTVTDTRTLRNAGTGTWNSGLISFGADAQFINDTNATLDYKATSGTTTGNGLLTNKGTFTLNDGTILDSSARFNNEGLIDIQGSSRLTFGNDSTHTGTVTGSTSAVLQFRGGTASLVAVSTMIDGPEMRISGGVVNGSGDLTVDGLLSWTGGVLRGSGTIIAAGALDIDGNGTVTDTRTLRNAGTGTWNSGLISFGADAQFINDTNATLDYKATSGTTTGNGLLTNKGTFTLNDGTILDSSARFNNEGLIDIQGTGHLKLRSGSAQITGTLLLNGGTLQTTTINIQGGSVTGSGTIAGTVNSTGGTISPGKSGGDIGHLNITGDLTLSQASQLTIDIGGPGRGTDYDSVDVGGTIRANGDLMLALVDGFTASQTDQFAPLIASTAVEDSFDNAPNGGRVYIPDGFGSVSHHYGSTDNTFPPEQVVLTDFTVELDPLADLAISVADIGFLPTNATPGQPVTINATVTNHGLVDATDIDVHFFDENNVLLDTDTLAALAPGDLNQATIQATFPDNGFKMITIKIDPDDTISELRESNNETSRLLQIGTPDPADVQLIVTAPPAASVQGQAISITGRADYDFNLIEGTQDFPVQGAQVTVTISEQGPNGNVLGIFTGSHTRSNGSFGQSILVPNVVGTYDMLIEVTDNTATDDFLTTLTVSAAPQPPDNPIDPNNTPPPDGQPDAVQDIYVFSDDIIFTDANPDIGQQITIFAYIHYFSSPVIPVADVPVAIDQIFPVDGVLQSFQLNRTVKSFPGDEVPVFVSIPFIGVPGAQVIQVVTDPAGANPSVTQYTGNDQATRLISVGPHPAVTFDKTVSLLDDADDDLIVSPGDTLRYTLNFVNTGAVELTDLTIIDDLDESLLDLPMAVDISDGGEVSDGKIIWNTTDLGTLTVGASGSVTYDVMVQPTDGFPLGTSVIVNTAFLNTNETAPIGTTTTIEVVHNPNAVPQVEDQSFTIDENSDNGTVVGVIAATDPDAGDTLTFSVTGGTGDTAFAVDAGTGQITVTDASQLDFETINQFTLAVDVTDNDGLNDSATITIDINNVAPTADAGGPYSVVEDSTVLLAGSATDPGGDNNTLTFQWDLDGDGTFGETGADAARGDETGVMPAFDAAGLAGGTSFVVDLQVTDDGGGTGTDSATINILSLGVPVDVTAITINDSQDQRSTLETISVVFNQDVNIADLIASSQIGNAVVLTDLSIGSAVVIDPSRFAYVLDTASGQGTLTIDLDSGLGAGGILTDSNYQLSLTNLIHAVGDNTNTLALNTSNPIHQLRGDFDGDGDRDIVDRARLLASFGSTVSESNDHFDLDGSGTLNVFDYVTFLFG